MTAQKMWEIFSEQNQISAEFDVWHYGSEPDHLAQLTLDGIKTATASAFCLYELVGEALPEPGEYSVILNSNDEAVCIIRTENVFVVPFCQVGARQAWKEGEGNRSLEYWLSVHEAFFRNELEEAGLVFDSMMQVVCEEFIRVYP